MNSPAAAASYTMHESSHEHVTSTFPFGENAAAYTGPVGLFNVCTCLNPPAAAASYTMHDLSYEHVTSTFPFGENAAA